jgi:hypothetical protein
MKEAHIQEPMTTKSLYSHEDSAYSGSRFCIKMHFFAIQNAPKSNKKPQKLRSKCTFSKHHESTLPITPGASLCSATLLT